LEVIHILEDLTGGVEDEGTIILAMNLLRADRA
jgi:hypothetical protein